MRVTLIHNPGAGDETHDKKALLQLIHEAGHAATYQSSKKDDWTDALKEPADLIAVAGGDGSIGKVARRMKGSGIPLAVLPMGTANNIARALGIAKLTPEELIAAWDKGRRVGFDLGVARWGGNDAWFIEGIGAGLFAWTIPEADDSKMLNKLDLADAKIAYARQMLAARLKDCMPVAIEAALDGKDISGEYLMFQAMNTPYVGPNLLLAPRARPDDGRLDVVLVADTEREALLEYLSGWRDGAHEPPALPTRRGRRLQIEWRGLELHIDDELVSESGREEPQTMDVELENGAVAFVVPRGRLANRRKPVNL